ncbi:MAG TPA: hypothetical protein VIF32_10045 [Gemmatimonadaceae bacterium]
MTRYGMGVPLAVALAIATTGCGEGSTAPIGSKLTHEEIVALAREFQGQTLQLSGDTLVQANGVAAAAGVPVTVDVALDTTLQCEGGQGTVRFTARVHGTIDEERRNATLRFDVTLTHRACAIQAASGKMIEVTGAPNITMQLEFVVADGELADPITGTTRGAFTWRSGNERGECALDLTTTLSPSTGEGRVRGTICGETIDEST